MDFYEVLEQIHQLLQSCRRVTYRALKARFKLDDEYLEAPKEELIYGQRLAVDEDERVLVRIGAAGEVPRSPALSGRGRGR